MENSIEKDIIILEQLIIANENCIKNTKMKDNPFVAIWEKQNRALEHILSDYKRTLKENEELKEENKNIDIYIAEKYNLGQQDGIDYEEIIKLQERKILKIETILKELRNK